MGQQVNPPAHDLTGSAFLDRSGPNIDRSVRHTYHALELPSRVPFLSSVCPALSDRWSRTVGAGRSVTEIRRAHDLSSLAELVCPPNRQHRALELPLSLPSPSASIMASPSIEPAAGLGALVAEERTLLALHGRLLTLTDQTRWDGQHVPIAPRAFGQSRPHAPARP